MKLHYISYSEIDKLRYDKCIDNSVNGNIFALSWYLDTVCQNWDIIVDEQYKCVMPLPYIIKKGKKHLTQPILCNQLGIYSSYLMLPSLFNSFYCELEGRFDSSYLVMNKMNSLTSESIFFWNCDIIKPISKIIDNSIFIDTINSYTIKYNVEYAELAQLWIKNPEIQSLPYSEQNNIIMNYLINNLYSKSLGSIIGAYDSNNQLTSISVWTWTNNQIHLIFAASNTKNTAINGFKNIIEYIIQHNCEKAITVCLPSWIVDYEPNISLLGFQQYNCPVFELKETKANWFKKLF